MSASKIVMRIVSISFSALVFIVVIYGLYQIGIRSYDYGYRIFTDPPMSIGEGTDKLVQIKYSMDALDIGELLEDKGLIRDARLFAIQAVIYGHNKTMAAGTYTLNTSMTPREMMQIMSGEKPGESEEEQ